MKYGEIAGNRRINTLIYNCFDYISRDDERKFIKAFRAQPPESHQAMHTLRELVLGAHLASCGINARYNLAIGAYAPDWCMLDEKSGARGIIELLNLHVDRETEDEIGRQRRAKGVASYWRDGKKNNVDRLYDRIQDKARAYHDLVERERIPYAIAVFTDILMAMDMEEIKLCVSNEETGLFTLFPSVSGILHFEENDGLYSFSYLHNPHAERALDLPEGSFPPDVD